MADTEADFSAEGIRNFIISRGGRVRNVELVGHYKKVLNDPRKKAENRQSFKDFINAVAVVKVENDEKTLVLKKPAQDWSSPKASVSREPSLSKRPAKAPPPPPPDSPTRRIPSPSPRPRTRPPETPPPPPPTNESPVTRPVPKPRSSKKQKSSPPVPEPVPRARKQISAPRSVPRSRKQISAPIPMSTSQPNPESARQPGVESMEAEPVYAELSRSMPDGTPPSNGIVRNGGQNLEEYTGPKEQVSYVTPKEGERIIDANSQISSVRNQASFFQKEVEQQAQEAEAMRSPMRTPKQQKSVEYTDTGTSKEEYVYTTLSDSPELEKSSSLQSCQSLAGDVGQDLPDLEISLTLQSCQSLAGDVGQDLPELEEGSTLQSFQSLAGDVGQDAPKLEKSATLQSCQSLASYLGQLDPLEREWMVFASQGNVGAMCNLLPQDQTLCSKKDFITTALHWGAKLGKKEMIKLVADRGADVNTRSQGGYTALHIAAMHHKETIMQLLIQDYSANVDIRDYSGKKPKHYLKKTASTFIQQMLEGAPSVTLERLRSRQQHIIHEVIKTRPKNKIASFRYSLRHSFNFWSSDDDGQEHFLRTPPPSPKLSRWSPRDSPMSSPRLGMKVSRSNDELLMPPPMSRPPKSKTVISRPKSAAPNYFVDHSNTTDSNSLKKSESDPNLAESTTEAMLV